MNLANPPPYSTPPPISSPPLNLTPPPSGVICNICHLDLLKEGIHGHIRGYGCKLIYDFGEVNWQRALDKTALQLLPMCGHIVHLSCLNIRCSIDLAEYIETEWVKISEAERSQSVDPPNRCFCNVEIGRHTFHARISGHKEMGLYLDNPSREPRNVLYVAHVFRTRLEEEERLEEIRIASLPSYEEDDETDDDVESNMDTGMDIMESEVGEDDDEEELEILYIGPQITPLNLSAQE